MFMPEAQEKSRVPAKIVLSESPFCLLTDEKKMYEITISIRYTHREKRGFSISFPPQIFKPEFMKRGLPSGSNWNLRPISEKKLCIGIPVNIMEIDEKGFVDGIKESLRQPLTELVKFVNGGIHFF